MEWTELRETFGGGSSSRYRWWLDAKLGDLDAGKIRLEELTNPNGNRVVKVTVVYDRPFGAGRKGRSSSWVTSPVLFPSSLAGIHLYYPTEPFLSRFA